MLWWSTLPSVNTVQTVADRVVLSHTLHAGDLRLASRLLSLPSFSTSIVGLKHLAIRRRGDMSVLGSSFDPSCGSMWLIRYTIDVFYTGDAGWTSEIVA